MFITFSRGFSLEMKNSRKHGKEGKQKRAEEKKYPKVFIKKGPKEEIFSKYRSNYECFSTPHKNIHLTF